MPVLTARTAQNDRRFLQAWPTPSDELATVLSGLAVPAGPAAVKTGMLGSFVAQVAEVTVKADGSYRLDRVVCAVDCGIAINPDVIKAQMEGGIGFALAAARHSAITLKEGRVDAPVLAT